MGVLTICSPWAVGARRGSGFSLPWVWVWLTVVETVGCYLFVVFFFFFFFFFFSVEFGMLMVDCGFLWVASGDGVRCVV